MRLTYKDWMRLVNSEVIKISGVTEADLGDWDSRAEWEAGTSPSDAAHIALEGSDFPFEDLEND